MTPLKRLKITLVSAFFVCLAVALATLTWLDIHSIGKNKINFHLLQNILVKLASLVFPFVFKYRTNKLFLFQTVYLYCILCIFNYDIYMESYYFELKPYIQQQLRIRNTLNEQADEERVRHNCKCQEESLSSL